MNGSMRACAVLPVFVYVYVYVHVYVSGFVCMYAHAMCACTRANTDA